MVPLPQWLTIRPRYSTHPRAITRSVLSKERLATTSLSWELWELKENEYSASPASNPASQPIYAHVLQLVVSRKQARCSTNESRALYATIEACSLGVWVLQQMARHATRTRMLASRNSAAAAAAAHGRVVWTWWWVKSQWEGLGRWKSLKTWLRLKSSFSHAQSRHYRLVLRDSYSVRQQQKSVVESPVPHFLFLPYSICFYLPFAELWNLPANNPFPCLQTTLTPPSSVWCRQNILCPCQMGTFKLTSEIQRPPSNLPPSTISRPFNKEHSPGDVPARADLRWSSPLSLGDENQRNRELWTIYKSAGVVIPV